MRNYLLTGALSAAILFLAGCSSKEYYKPESVKGSWQKRADLNETMVDVNAYGAILEADQQASPEFAFQHRTVSRDNPVSVYVNRAPDSVPAFRNVLTANGLLKKQVPDGYRFIGYNESYLIVASTEGNLQLIPLDETEQNLTFPLGKTVAAASVENGVLAVLFADNTMALYDTASQALIMKEQGNAPIAVDNRIANPQFLNELVLFPTLDGKIVILNVQTKQQLRTIIVSSKQVFDNVIFLKMIGDTMVAATSNRVFSMAEKERRENYEIRDIVFEKEGLWITTKQGEVIALTPSLDVRAKQKFPFAHFMGMIVSGEKIYLLEKEGYLIALEKDLSSYEVYDADIEEGYVFVGDQAFYIHEEMITVE